MPDDHHETMQCMEVWGGNQAVNSGIVMAGLDAWVYCRPFSGIGTTAPAAGGGDVYFVSSCATGRITRLLVADVSGHGVSVSEVATSLRTLMRKYVNYLDPQKFVGEMNRQFSDLSKGGCFATAVVTTYFSPTNHMTFCNAGHPPPMLYRAGKGWSYLESARNDGDTPSDLPLGVEGSSGYNEVNVKLGLGDMVLCYTDGLPESRRPDGDFLGQDGLLNIAAGIDTSDPTTVVPTLLQKIAELYPGNLSGDDITVLLFRSNGVGVMPPFLKRAAGPLRLLGAIFASLVPGGRPVPWPDFSLANMGGALIAPMNRLRKRKS